MLKSEGSVEQANSKDDSTIFRTDALIGVLKHDYDEIEMYSERIEMSEYTIDII